MGCSYKRQKKGVTIANAFKKVLDDSKTKLHKKWSDKGSEFYNISIKSWSEKKIIQRCIQHVMKENLLLLKIYQKFKK